MDTRQLEYMLCVEKHRSISRAAEELYISPSALSQQIKQLEFELGTRLFRRSGGGMIPTTDGNIYLSGARQMLKLKQDAVSRIRAMGSEESERMTIRLALNRDFLSFFNASIKHAFEARFPYMKLEPVVVDETSAKDEVLHGNADMAFIIASGIKASSLDSIPIQKDALHLAFPTWVTEEGASDVDYEEIIRKLRYMGYISAPFTGLRGADMYYLRCAGLEPDTLCYTTSYRHLKELLNRQFAYGILPENFIEKSDEFAHIPIRPEAYYTLCIVLSDSLSITEEVKELILIFLREFDIDHGGKSMRDILEHGC